MDIINNLKDNVTRELSGESDSRRKVNSIIDKYSEMFEETEEKKHFLDYLNNKKDIVKIYKLIKDKKLTNNQIKVKIKEFLKNPDELKDFLTSLLKHKDVKKSENTEATSSGGSGQFSSPLFSSTKGDVVKKVKTVREYIETDGEKGLSDNEPVKKETKEATTTASSGQYSQPSIWAKSLNKKDFRGKSKPQIPGGKFVQVKKKCKTFPYCNQGDINALRIFENKNVQKAIKVVSENYGMDETTISEIVFNEIKKRQK
jgi:hypothetical protein